MTASRHRRTAAATVMSAVAVTALVGGTLAQFTDSDTTATQRLQAGTVEVNLVEGAGWNTNLTNLAVGDTADRTVLVDNTSTLDVGAMRLTADLTDQVGEFGGRLSEAVTVDVTQNPTGASPVVLAQDVRLADLAAGYDLTFAGADLPAHTDVNLGFHYEVVGARPAETGNRLTGQRDLPTNPDNKYQGSGLTVRYTIDAIQRAGFDDSTALAPTDVTATRTGINTATVSFTTPSSNETGTVYTATAVEEPTMTAATTAEPTLSVTATTSALSASGLTSPITVKNLIGGHTYRFVVTATGPNGTPSKPSDPSNTVTIPDLAGTATGWGYNAYGQTTTPAGLTDLVQVSAGNVHTAAVRKDGTVVTWGYNGSGQRNVPAGLTGVRQVSAAWYHTLALKNDGTVVGWGDNAYGQAVAPAGLSNVTQVAAGRQHSVALKNDGTVIAWGFNDKGQATVPAGLSDVVAVTAGYNHSAALKADGSVVVWGVLNTSQVNMPAGLTNVKTIESGDNHILAIKNDGTVVAWGQNVYGQATVPAGLVGITAIAGGKSHSMALKSDGTVVTWGSNSYGQTNTPAGLSNVIGISGGGDHSEALVAAN